MSNANNVKCQQCQMSTISNGFDKLGLVTKPKGYNYLLTTTHFNLKNIGIHENSNSYTATIYKIKMPVFVKENTTLHLFIYKKKLQPQISVSEYISQSAEQIAIAYNNFHRSGQSFLFLASVNNSSSGTLMMADFILRKASSLFST